MTLSIAMFKCKVRGYIARDSKPDKKYWKNTLYFEQLPETLGIVDKVATDWQLFDPEGEETSITG